MSVTLERPKRKTKCKECGAKGGHIAGCSKAPCDYCGEQVGHKKDCPEFVEPDVAAAVDAAIDAERGEVETIVDGQPAKIVLNGKNGEPTQPELLQTTLHDRIIALAKKREELTALETRKKSVSEQCKAAQSDLNTMVDQLIAQNAGREIPLPLGETADADEEGDEEVGEATLTGGERRALQLAADAPPATAKAETVNLSEREPGTFVANEEGPE